MRNSLKIALLAASLSPLFPMAARAQFDRPFYGEPSSQPALSATGYVRVKRQAEAMRVYVELVSQGKTVEEALKELKARREGATKKFTDLGTDVKSAEFTDAKISETHQRQREQFRAMVRSRMPSGFGMSSRKVPAGLKVPKSVAVTTTLTVDWPLKGKTNDELLIESEALKEKIKEADLGGTKDKQDLSPEEQELAEEMAEMMRNNGDEPVPVGEPYFVFVAKVSDADAEKATSEAVKKAKDNAVKKAKIIETPLGKLLGVSYYQDRNSRYDNSDPYYGGYGYERQNYYQRLLASQDNDPDEGGKESTGSDLSQTFVFAAAVTYELKSE